MPTSVRLDADTQALVDRLARKTGRTKSDVIRGPCRRCPHQTRRARRDPQGLHDGSAGLRPLPAEPDRSIHDRAVSVRPYPVGQALMPPA